MWQIWGQNIILGTICFCKQIQCSFIGQHTHLVHIVYGYFGAPTAELSSSTDITQPAAID